MVHVFVLKLSYSSLSLSLSLSPLSLSLSLQLIDQMGTVHNVLDSGDIRVRYPNNRTWTLNPASLTKVTQFAVGDVIKIIDDIALVHDLQEDHGGWVDDMALVSQWCNGDFYL